MLLTVDALQDDDLDHRPHQRGHQHRQQQCRQEADSAAQPVGGDNGHEGRHHVQRPMRHVDDPQRSENEGEPCCHDEQVGRVGQPTHREQQELARIHV